MRHINSITWVVLLAALSLASCGGGDDGGDVVDTPATIPDVLNYEIKQADDTDLVIDQSERSVTITSALLTGTFDRTNDDFTLVPFGPAMSVDAGSFLDGLYGSEFNNYVLQVEKTLTWNSDNSPTDGEFVIRDQTVVTRIRVTATPTGVDLEYFPSSVADPVLNSSVSWQEFDGMFADESAEAYERIAAFAYSVLRFMYEQGGLVISSLEYLGDNDLLLENNLSLAESCDPYPYGTTDPTVSDPGETLITWNDDSFDGSLGPGDSFLAFYTECWVNDDSDDFDQLYDGSVNLVYYVEVEQDGVITRIGFEPFDSATGGIDFDNIEIIETETDASRQLVIIDQGSKLVLNGGFSMVFTSQ